jgi:hypothetical protein
MSLAGHFDPLCSMGWNGSSSLNNFPADRMPATEGLGQQRKSTALQKKFNPRPHATWATPEISSMLPHGYRPHPNSHIFIPGDMPFISFLLVAGPCAPTPSTSRETCTLPAFSNSKVIGSLSPFLSGLFKSIIIK